MARTCESRAATRGPRHRGAREPSRPRRKPRRPREARGTPRSPRRERRCLLVGLLLRGRRGWIKRVIPEIFVSCGSRFALSHG